MRIAYVTEPDAHFSSGVLNKIRFQIRQWQSLGNEVNLFLVSSPSQKVPVHQPNNTVIIYSFFLRGITWNIKGVGYLNKILSTKKLQKALEHFQPDIIYYRQALWYPGIVGVLKNIGPYVMEINTKDTDEYKMAGWIMKSLYLATRRFALQEAAGFIAITHEIEKTLHSFEKPVSVVGNGYDISEVSQRKPPRNKRIQLIHVFGANQSWQGLDKVILMALLMPDCDFHLVGPMKSEKVGQNLVVHGFLGHAALASLYKKIDIGIGTLALYRKNMCEASPLKVREYVAYGIPVVIGYIDVDLKGCPFVLNIGNYERNVPDNIGKIKQFVSAWKGVEITKDTITRVLRSEEKEKERLKYMKRIVNER